MEEGLKFGAQFGAHLDKKPSPAVVNDAWPTSLWKTLRKVHKYWPISNCHKRHQTIVMVSGLGLFTPPEQQVAGSNPARRTIHFKAFSADLSFRKKYKLVQVMLAKVRPPPWRPLPASPM